jgi:UDP-N-acetylglucosamine 1-carboxyvinyltransferase
VTGRRQAEDSNYARTVHFTARNIVDITAPYELVSKMRASFWVIGPLLARMGEARFRCPAAAPSARGRSTCSSISGSARRRYRHRERLCACQGEERAGRRALLFPEGLGRRNACDADGGALAKGDTVIENPAREPEVVNLADCLNAMGAKIEGAGTDEIRMTGVTSLSGARHRVIPDRIETGTYAMAVGMTGGDVVLKGARRRPARERAGRFARGGHRDHGVDDGIRVYRNGNGLMPVDVRTDPYPGFPTDLQAQLMGLMSGQRGLAHHRNDLREPLHACAGTGAARRDISLNGQTATVHGVPVLKGAPVMATDLRASVSLVIAGLAAEGETTVNRVYHLDRGFERLEEKLTNCGAVVERISG